MSFSITLFVMENNYCIHLICKANKIYLSIYYLFIYLFLYKDTIGYNRKF